MYSTLTKLDLRDKDPVGKQIETLLKLSFNIYHGTWHLGQQYENIVPRQQKSLRVLRCPLPLYKGIWYTV